MKSKYKTWKKVFTNKNFGYFQIQFFVIRLFHDDASLIKKKVGKIIISVIQKFMKIY